jgi:hypothetical protein
MIFIGSLAAAETFDRYLDVEKLRPQAVLM